ncbi:methyl-accepting chemotaxis protein [Pseudoalteromonas fenneropenaei]|uniref:Methyl-accepting chemotaxis protein n=1 Tax=Pseudoalteromonas fenneropenaei TaxID=1737459 RepID=A0ABV7CMW3_9GAMM
MVLDFTIKQKLLILVLLPLVVFSASCLFVVIEMNRVQHDVDAMFESHLLPAQELTLIKDDLTVKLPEIFRQTRFGELSVQEAAIQLDTVRQHAAKEWLLVRDSKHDNATEQLLIAAEQQMVVMNSKLDTLTNQLSSGQLASLSEQVFNQHLNDAVLPINQHLRTLLDAQVKAAFALKQAADHDATFTRTTMEVASVMLILLLGISGVLVQRAIRKPLFELERAITNITTHADLTERVQVQGNDELSRIGNAFNNMVEKLQQLVNSILSGVMTLSAASEEMSTISQLMAATSQQQGQQTTMIATAVTQMNAAIEEVARNAVHTASKASDVATLTEQGNQIVAGNIASISSLSGMVMKNADLIQALNHQSNEINQVVLMIQAVAEQTNLLALNAAIEAARAGESGRGFAVVADEVRQLAHNTQKATESIRDMIMQLQKMSQNAVNAMGAAEQSAEQSRAHAEQSAVIIKQINSAIAEIVLMNAQVSSATEQQSTVVAEISQNINDFNDSIGSVSENAQQNADASAELANLGAKLKSQVSHFSI